jgi:hypothetical protein
VKISEDAVGVLAGIRTELFPDKRPKQYCLSRLSSDVSILIHLFGVTVPEVDRMREYDAELNH